MDDLIGMIISWSWRVALTNRWWLIGFLWAVVEMLCYRLFGYSNLNLFDTLSNSRQSLFRLFFRLSFFLSFLTELDYLEIPSNDQTLETLWNSSRFFPTINDVRKGFWENDQMNQIYNDRSHSWKWHERAATFSERLEYSPDASDSLALLDPFPEVFQFVCAGVSAEQSNGLLNAIYTRRHNICVMQI